MTPREQILETMRRVLQQTTLRAILKPLGRTPIEVSPEEAKMLLTPYEEAIEHDFVMCVEVANQLVALSHQGAYAREIEETAGVLSFNSEDDEDSDR